jgi:hypothetical protein
MAGHGEAELTGLAKHFNSTTFTGRANVAKVRYWVNGLQCYVGEEKIIYFGSASLMRSAF